LNRTSGTTTVAAQHDAYFTAKHGKPLNIRRAFVIKINRCSALGQLRCRVARTRRGRGRCLVKTFDCTVATLHESPEWFAW